uniref:Uncharacterized protein n=1 Tax=Amphimedon queenslandica TaxID=400682 RepID=A0A1X7SL88_AMPQE
MTSQFKSIRFSVPIPIRWYMFEIKMNEEGLVCDKEVISLKSCYTIVILERLSASAAALDIYAVVTYFHQKHRRHPVALSVVPIDNLLPEGSVL